MNKRDLPHHCRLVDVTEGSVWADDHGKWLISNYLMTGDYVDSYARSNARVFERDFADGEGTWWRWAGGAIAIRTLAYRNCKDVRDTLDALADYPLLDESDHSELEQEDQQENWESWARDDFRRELRRVIEAHFTAHERETDDNGLEPDEIVDRISDEQIDTLFWELCRQEEEYPEYTGGDVNFPLVDMANAWAGESPKAKRDSKWYRVHVLPGMLPGFDENGKTRSQADEILEWYSAFAINPCCPRCGDEKRIGECHEHTDCALDAELGRACSNALKTFKSAFEHACDDPDCAAVHEARRLHTEREALKPGAQLSLALAC